MSGRSLFRPPPPAAAVSFLKPGCQACQHILEGVSIHGRIGIRTYSLHNDFTIILKITWYVSLRNIFEFTKRLFDDDVALIVANGLDPKYNSPYFRTTYDPSQYLSPKKARARTKVDK